MSEITEGVAHWLTVQARSEVEAEDSFFPFGVMIKEGQRQYLLLDGEQELSPQQYIDTLVGAIDQQAAQSAIDGAGICFIGRISTSADMTDSWREITAVAYESGQHPEIWSQRVLNDSPDEDTSFGELTRMGTTEEVQGSFPIIPSWTP